VAKYNQLLRIEEELGAPHTQAGRRWRTLVGLNRGILPAGPRPDARERACRRMSQTCQGSSISRLQCEQALRSWVWQLGQMIQSGCVRVPRPGQTPLRSLPAGLLLQRALVGVLQRVQRSQDQVDQVAQRPHDGQQRRRAWISRSGVRERMSR
jgi:hypothetical protein